MMIVQRRTHAANHCDRQLREKRGPLAHRHDQPVADAGTGIGDAGLGADLDDGGNLLGAGGPDDQRRVAVEQAARLDQSRRPHHPRRAHRHGVGVDEAEGA